MSDVKRGEGVLDLGIGTWEDKQQRLSPRISGIRRQSGVWSRRQWWRAKTRAMAAGITFGLIAGCVDWLTGIPGEIRRAGEQTLRPSQSWSSPEFLNKSSSRLDTTPPRALSASGHHRAIGWWTEFSSLHRTETLMQSITRNSHSNRLTWKPTSLRSIHAYRNSVAWLPPAQLPVRCPTETTHTPLCYKRSIFAIHHR